MTDTLKNLLDLTRHTKMSSAEAEAQRRSFAYGNAKIENDRVSRAMVDDAADQMQAAKTQ